MFIQLDCGCIGLLLESGYVDGEFFKMIDCRDQGDHSINLDNSTNDLEYKRFRYLNDEEVSGLIKLIQVAFVQSDKYERIRDALELPIEEGLNVRFEWDRIAARNRTFKAYDSIDKPKVFPFDYRNDDEKQKEIDYIKRHLK